MTELYYAEDDADIANAVKEYLEQKDMKVQIYHTISEVRQALEKHVAAVVLLDWNMPCRQIIFFAAGGWLIGLSLFFFTFLYRNRMENRRIRDLAEYLGQVNSGKALILSTPGEDDFSKLEDEIYKTVTFLYQTKEQAVQVKNDFAENLSNIAHQIKTPITAISLNVQRMKRNYDDAAPERQKNHNVMEQKELRTALEQVNKQLSRLTYLEESLLILSWLDAGTLVLQKEETDVYTILVLAADNLQELFLGSDTSIEIPEQGEMLISVDMDWTMEALMNLMKNCMEHNEGETVHCSYTQNSLYTEILIWDEGEGFAKEDMPHVFEWKSEYFWRKRRMFRFYCSCWLS